MTRPTTTLLRLSRRLRPTTPRPTPVSVAPEHPFHQQPAHVGMR